MTGSRLPGDPPIFDYRPLLPRRRNRRNEQPRMLVPSDYDVYPTKYDLCAVGRCGVCGRTLIDATRQQRGSYFTATCGRCYHWPKP